MDVFFSYEQSAVIGTNLLRGPYASTGMAAIVTALRASQNEDDYRVSDFEAYRPALGQPKNFIATPVFDGPRLVAIMVLRFPIEPITAALSNNREWEAEGLGKTGEVFLFGPDQTMRSDSRFLIEDRAAFLESLRRSRPDHPHSGRRGAVQYDHPDGAGQGRGSPCRAERADRHHGVRQLPRCARPHGLRAGRSRFFALGSDCEDRQGRGAGTVDALVRRLVATGRGPRAALVAAGPRSSRRC